MPKYAGKYETPEDLEKAYLEAQGLIGKHGEEKKSWADREQQFAQERQGFTDYAQSLAPMVAWYRNNLPWLQQAWQQRQVAQQRAQQPQIPGVNVPSGWDQLSSAQQYQLMVQSAGQHAQRLAMAALQQYAPRYAQQVEQAVTQRVKNGFDVFYRGLERVTPKDQMDGLRAYVEESLKFADPSKINPMDLANETLAMRTERDSAIKERDELKKWREEREKAEVPSLGAGASTRAFDLKPSGDRLSREDRFKAAVDAVKTDHGTEGVSALFGDRAA